MNSFEVHDDKEHDSHFIDKQAAFYEQGEDDCKSAANVSTFSRTSFNCYVSLLGSPYGQQATNPHSLSPQYSPAYPDHTSMHHQSPESMWEPQLTESPGYLPLRDTFCEQAIESQESPNEDTMLSEPVIPPLDGFPDVREFDRLMNRFGKSMLHWLARNR